MQVNFISFSHYASWPPSTVIIVPLTNSFSARKVIVWAISSGRPALPAGIALIESVSIFFDFEPYILSQISVSITPGAIALARILFFASSNARVLVKLAIADFDAQ